VAGVTREVRAAESRLPDRVVIGVLTSVFPPALVDEVIDAAGARERRSRSLPARLTVYFTLALWLFMGCGYDAVIRNLVEGLAWTQAGWGSWRVPPAGSITKARARLGPEPLRLLFERAAGPVGTEGMAGVFWRGLRLVALDGTSVEVPDSAANSAAFGRPTGSGGWQGAYPQVTLVALAECGTRALLGAAFGGYRAGEQTLAAQLTSQMRAGMLVLADRNFPSVKLWSQASAQGAELLWRVKAKIFTLPVLQVLPDGTYLSEVTSGKGSRQRRISVRVIDYTVTTTTPTGHQASEPFRLITTLTSPARAPARELARLYHQRWQIETLFAAIKTAQRGGAGVILRSHHPGGVRQELWAMLCTYHALRGLMATAAHASGTAPLQISFTQALHAARRSLAHAADFPPARAD
jgi:Insertion element 4 transposase N-terminal/Transposase DDE domain